MFTIRCEKCKNEILVDKEKLYDIVKNYGEIELIVSDTIGTYIQIFCNKCYNYIELKD